MSDDEIILIEPQSQPQPQKVYSSYTPSQAKANKKWADKNKEKLLEYGRRYGKTYYEQNKEKIKKKNLERYHKKKAEKLNL